MIVTAALAWFDESLEDLDRCVRSLPVVADRLVAVDGGYARWPGAAASSPKQQAAQIRKTAKDVGIDVVVDVPKRMWLGQVQKRSHLLTLAGKGSDWVAVVDADHILYGLRYSVRHELDQIDDCDAVTVSYYTPMNYERPLKESAAGLWHESLAGDYALITTIFRALPELRVERFHWWYSALKGQQRHWVCAGDGSYPKVKVHQLHAPYFVEHRCLFRDTKHVLANREFCNDREKIVREHRQEDPPVEMAA